MQLHGVFLHEPKSPHCAMYKTNSCWARVKAKFRFWYLNDLFCTKDFLLCEK